MAHNGTAMLKWKCLSHSIHEMEDIWNDGFYNTLVQDDQHIYMVGGTSRKVAYDPGCLPAFHLETSTWRMLRTKPDPQAPDSGYPAARRGHSCIQYQTLAGQSEIVIAGGSIVNTSTTGPHFDDIWKLNLVTMQWHLLKSVRLPKNVVDIEMTISGNGLLYIFGIDIDYERNDFHQRKYAYKLFKVWVTIPKLSEICWAGIVTMQPRLSSFSVDKLCEVGIPKRFVGRLNRGGCC